MLLASGAPIASPATPSSETPKNFFPYPGVDSTQTPHLLDQAHAHGPLPQPTSIQLASHLGGAAGLVIVCSGCYHKNTIKVAYKQHTFIIHGSGGWEIEDQDAGEDLLPASLMAVICVLTW